VEYGNDKVSPSFGMSPFPGMPEMPPSDVGKQKTPPHSLEAEESVLGGLLYQNQSLLALSDLNLLPEDFYKEGHQRVYRAITMLLSRGEPADLVTVTNQMRSTGDLDRSGGARYLSELADRAFSAANVPFYAKIVKEKSVLRSFIRTASELVGNVYTGIEDQEAFLDDAEKRIFSVTSLKQTNSFEPIKEILLKNFLEIEQNAANQGGPAGVPSGFTDLDSKTTGWKPGQLIIIAARPGMGKTSFMLNLGVNCALQQKPAPVAFFSMEMSKEELGMRLLSMESRVDSHRLRTGRLQGSDWQNIQRAAGKLSEAPFFLDDTAALNLMEIKSRCRRIQSLHGLSLVVVDYLQLMRGTSGSRNMSMNREQEISEISRGLKALAKELGVPVIAASQLNRGVESRNDKRPMLSDLRESGAIEQDADMVIFIHRDEVYNRDNSEEKGIGEVIIGKHRAGAVGSVKLAWIGQYTTFANLAQD
jgi:replicative DNA helicase